MRNLHTHTHTRFLIAICSIVLLTSCNQADDAFKGKERHQKRELTNSEKIAMWVSSNPQKISQKQAEFYAVEFAKQLESSGRTKSARRTIGNVAVLETGTPGTKSGSSDTVAYVVNFSDENGFAVVSADPYSQGVLAFIDEGSLNVGDTITNPGFAQFISAIPAYQEDQRMEFEGMIYDTMAHNPNPFPDDGPRRILVNSHSLTERLEIDDGPMIKVNWGQDNPENKFLNGTQVGCGAVAIAQVMSYYKYPAAIDGYTFDWDKMTSDKFAYGLPVQYQDQVAGLMKLIGSPNYGAAKYGVDGTKMSDENVVIALRNLYYHSSYTKTVFGQLGFHDYKMSSVLSSVKNKRPALVGGSSVRNTTFDFLGIVIHKYDSSHVWVVDGYQITRRNTYNTWYYPDTDEEVTDVIYSNTTNYFHCNWGWRNEYNCNGYFESGVFDSLKEYRKRYPHLSLKEYHYRYDLKMLTDIFR